MNSNHDDRKSSPPTRYDAMRAFGQFGTLGLSFVIALVIGVALGLWIDRLTGWSPWGFVTFFILGFAAGVLNVYRTFSRFK
jgi:ATP synthase protein I